MRLPCGFLQASQREPGGRGRIRTFVARKERQIYSLLVLATHPPVPRKIFETRITSPELVLQGLTGVPRKNTKRTRVKRHQPVRFCFQDSLRLTPPQNLWWSWRRELNPRPSDYKSDPRYMWSTVWPAVRIFVSRSAFRWDNWPFGILVSMVLMP